MGRRAAIFLHAKDVDNVKKGKSSTSLQPSQPPAAGKSPSKRMASSKKDPSDDSVRSCSVDSAAMENQKRDRRKSVAQAHQRQRRPSTLPNLSDALRPSDSRRQSTRRGSQLTHTSYGTRRASVRPPLPPPPKEEPALTKGQIAAFKEVFDLFDSNGGGTIDAEELQLALASVDIHLTEEEIKDVLMTIDKDGSGEIDFDEFLTMMTNTEKFLEMFAAKHEGENSAPIPEGAEGREMILFDALTKFMRSSALKQMDEIVGYYSTKYKRAQAPHVVMHYAAGARLIGLTEKQLVKHMKLLQQSNRENNYQSPYAQPLRFILSGPPPPRHPKRPVPPKPKEKQCTGKIKMKIRIVFKHNGTKDNVPEAEGDNSNTKTKFLNKVISNENRYHSVYTPRLGWVDSQVKTLEHRLPATHFVTLKDLPKIRTRIGDATREYQREVAETKRRDNTKYWKSLHPDLIPSTKLRHNFRKVFNAYINLDPKNQSDIKVPRVFGSRYGHML